MEGVVIEGVVAEGVVVGNIRFRIYLNVLHEQEYTVRDLNVGT